jgi:hypothetical protein
MGLRVALLVSVVSGRSERATLAVSGSWPLQAPIAGVGERQSPGVRLPEDVRPLRYALDLTVVPDARDFQGRIAIDALGGRAAARPSGARGSETGPRSVIAPDLRRWQEYAGDIDSRETCSAIARALRRAKLVRRGHGFIGELACSLSAV